MGKSQTATAKADKTGLSQSPVSQERKKEDSSSDSTPDSSPEKKEDAPATSLFASFAAQVTQMSQTSEDLRKKHQEEQEKRKAEEEKRKKEIEEQIRKAAEERQ